MVNSKMNTSEPIKIPITIEGLGDFNPLTTLKGRNNGDNVLLVVDNALLNDYRSNRRGSPFYVINAGGWERKVAIPGCLYHWQDAWGDGREDWWVLQNILRGASPPSEAAEDFPTFQYGWKISSIMDPFGNQATSLKFEYIAILRECEYSEFSLIFNLQRTMRG